MAASQAAPEGGLHRLVEQVDSAPHRFILFDERRLRSAWEEVVE